MAKVQISRLQFILVLVWCVLATGIVTVPFMTAQFTVRDGWIAGLLFAFGGLLAAGVAALFVRSFQNRSLISGLMDAFGPWLGRVMALWVLVWLFLVECKILRVGEMFVGSTIMPKTPEYILGLFGMVGISYVAYMGAEVVARDAEFITPIALIVAPGLIGLSMQHMDVRQLLPVLADGWKPVLRGAVAPGITYALELLIALQVVQVLRNHRTMPKDMVITTGILTVLAALTMVITAGVVGQAASYLNYPVLEVVRTIRVGRFLERLDTLYVMGVMSTICIKLAAFHYAWCEGMKDVFRLSSHRMVTLSGGLFLWAGSIACFRNAGEVTDFVMFVAPTFVVVSLVGIPLLAVAVKTVRKRQETKSNTKERRIKQPRKS
jgi:spore germination protein KB